MRLLRAAQRSSKCARTCSPMPINATYLSDFIPLYLFPFHLHFYPQHQHSTSSNYPRSFGHRSGGHYHDPGYALHGDHIHATSSHDHYCSTAFLKKHPPVPHRVRIWWNRHRERRRHKKGFNRRYGSGRKLKGEIANLETSFPSKRKETATVSDALNASTPAAESSDPQTPRPAGPPKRRCGEISVVTGEMETVSQRSEEFSQMSERFERGSQSRE